MAGRSSLAMPGFRPYHKELDDHPQPPTYPDQRRVTYGVLPTGKTYREEPDVDQNREYEQAYLVPQNRGVVDPSKTHVFPQDQDIRGTRVLHAQHSEPSNIQSQRSVTYRVLPNGKTYREEPDVDQNNRIYEQANLARQNRHAEPIKTHSKEDPLGAPVPATSHKSRNRLVEGRIHRWTMFRLWVNREISQEVRKERDPNREFKKRLDLPMDSMVTSVLVDPASDANGKRLQKEYGAKSLGGQHHFNILPENMYFVFGIPRAKTSIDANVSEFIETMSNAIARSEHDVLSTKDGLSTKDDNELINSNVADVFRKSRREIEAEDQRRPSDQYDIHRKDEKGEDEKYRKWHADDLKKSRYRQTDEIRETMKDREDQRVKKPDQWETDNLYKSRRLNSDDYDKDPSQSVEKHPPEPSEPHSNWNYGKWDDDDFGKSRNRGKYDIRKSRAEEVTDYGKYHVDDYEMPKKKLKEDHLKNFSNTKTASENVYATHVNK